jgi:hypothetical protein
MSRPGGPSEDCASAAAERTISNGSASNANARRTLGAIFTMKVIIEFDLLSGLLQPGIHRPVHHYDRGPLAVIRGLPQHFSAE